MMDRPRRRRPRRPFSPLNGRLFSPIGALLGKISQPLLLGRSFSLEANGAFRPAERFASSQSWPEAGNTPYPKPGLWGSWSGQHHLFRATMTGLLQYSLILDQLDSEGILPGNTLIGFDSSHDAKD